MILTPFIYGNIMRHSVQPIPNSVIPPYYAHPPPPPPTSSPPSEPLPSPNFRVSSEFDSESNVFTNRVSCKLFNGLAKLRLSFQNDKSGQVSDPSFMSKNLSIDYDPEEKSTVLNGSLDVGPYLRFNAIHDLKEQKGHVGMVAKLFDPGYVLELSSPVPSVGPPKASFTFPYGQVSVEDANKSLSVNGFLKAQILNGVCNLQYTEEELKLRYAYKDEDMSFIPSISLPSKALSFAFKQRFSPSNKLSYWYNFGSNEWSTVYKHTVNGDYTFKAGYDSDARLGWTSVWFGKEGDGAKTAPLKMKVQIMVQVPQDDIRSSVLMFRAKKRWDF